MSDIGITPHKIDQHTDQTNLFMTLNESFGGHKREEARLCDCPRHESEADAAYFMHYGALYAMDRKRRIGRETGEEGGVTRLEHIRQGIA